MLNSERIFSDSRTRAGIEDAFFRRAMAIYCENESKKVIAEMEADRTERESNAKPLERIFAKLRRERGFSSAFRIAKKVTDRVALLVLAAVIVFAGAVTASADVRSSLAEFTSRWGTFTNIGDESFDLDGEDVKSFSVDYATGWNFDSEGTRNIANGEKLFGGEVTETYSNYFINYSAGLGFDSYGPTICNANNYSIYYDENSSPIKGIVLKGESGIPLFYPYYDNDGNNLYMVCRRTEKAERTFKRNMILSLPDGTEVKVQPFNITLFMYNEADDPDLIIKLFEKSDCVEVEIKPSTIFVSGHNVSEDEELWGTWAGGEIKNLDAVNVIKTF